VEVRRRRYPTQASTLPPVRFDAKPAGVCVAILLTAACCFAPAAAARPPLKAIWGPTRMPDGSSAFREYKRLGVDVVQFQLAWDQIAPARPRHQANHRDRRYRWPATVDEGVRAARRRGIQVALLVRGSPPWANGGRSPEWVPSPRRYARFLTAASRRYRSVHRWMIWGEPNRAGAFQPLPPNKPTGPRAYARLLDAAYVALKHRSRHNIVVGGMTFSFGEVFPTKWLRWMRLPGGRRPGLDEYGHNPFTRRKPNIRLHGYSGYPGARDMSDMDTFAREVRQAYPHRRPRLWISEFTVSSDRPNRAFNFAVSRRAQAAWLKSAFSIAGKIGAAGMGWFNLQDEPASEPLGLTTGLMTYEGVRKPVYRAFRRAP
jgi:hypothetical protein